MASNCSLPKHQAATSLGEKMPNLDNLEAYKSTIIVTKNDIQPCALRIDLYSIETQPLQLKWLEIEHHLRLIHSKQPTSQKIFNMNSITNESAGHIDWALSCMIYCQVYAKKVTIRV